MNILVSTLGASWKIIPETIGLTNYSKVDFYKNHKDKSYINKIRNDYLNNVEVDELWLITTDRKSSIVDNKEISSIDEDIEDIYNWNNRCGRIVKRIRVWVLKGIPDIDNENTAEEFHDLTFRVIAYAKQVSGDGKLFLSLACGRKTMSANMQDAAYCFGCDALIHLLGDRLNTDLCTETIPEDDDINMIHPLFVGAYDRNEVISDYSKQEFDDTNKLRVTPSVDFLHEIRKLQDDAKYFYTSYYLDTNDNHNNFHILYTLPKNKIDELRTKKIGVSLDDKEKELEYLRQLPKVELHCHLGGVLNCEEMIEVASCYDSEIEQELNHHEDFSKWVSNINIENIQKIKDIKSSREKLAEKLHVKRYIINAAFLKKFKGKPEYLDKILFGKYIEESNYCETGISNYEALGDLQGSALLQSEKAIRKTVQILLDNAGKNNVLHLEVRCSPLNYTEGGLSPDEVLNIICEELEKESQIHKSLILIASRHSDLNKIGQSIELAKRMNHHKLFKKYFRGFDVAGNEESASPKELRDKFMNILKDCLNITIHAGETKDVNSIWEAVYELNAERIGHGLKLIDNESLLKKFLERKICIEMCPSSNFQIVGFRDNLIPNSSKYEVYPLKQYLDKELRVCVNTDNPGISRTDFTNELYRAARLTPGGLSIWNIFQLIHNGLRSSFCSYEDRKDVLYKAEKRIASLIKNDKI